MKQIEKFDRCLNHSMDEDTIMIDLATYSNENLGKIVNVQPNFGNKYHKNAFSVVKIEKELTDLFPEVNKNKRQVANAFILSNEEAEKFLFDVNIPKYFRIEGTLGSGMSSIDRIIKDFPLSIERNLVRRRYRSVLLKPEEGFKLWFLNSRERDILEFVRGRFSNALEVSIVK